MITKHFTELYDKRIVGKDNLIIGNEYLRCHDSRRDGTAVTPNPHLGGLNRAFAYPVLTLLEISNKVSYGEDSLWMIFDHPSYLNPERIVGGYAALEDSGVEPYNSGVGYYSSSEYNGCNFLLDLTALKAEDIQVTTDTINGDPAFHVVEYDFEY